MSKNEMLRNAWNQIPVSKAVTCRELAEMAGFRNPLREDLTAAQHILAEMMKSGAATRSIIPNPNPNPNPNAYVWAYKKQKGAPMQQDSLMIFLPKAEKAWKQIELGKEITVNDLLEMGGFQKDTLSRQRAYRFMKRAVRQGLAQTVVNGATVSYKKIRTRLPVKGQHGSYSLTNGMQQEKTETSVPLPPTTLTSDQFTKHVLETMFSYRDLIQKQKEEIQKLKAELEHEKSGLEASRQELKKAVEDCKETMNRNVELQQEVADLKMNSSQSVRDIFKRASEKDLARTLKEAASRA